jgi:glycerol-3-phosphate dehydrogenase
VAIESLAGEPLDVLIVGGGIVGSGIARDAAMRGLRVGLVEQHDFAFGTSSRSSRLLHGGMRYLAQGRLGLVRQASVEKKIVHHIAPHLADPLPFIFPTYEDQPDWRLWQLKIGVKIYDLLCGGRNLGNSSWLRPAETLRKVGGLRSEKLCGSVRYYDGFTNDARLVIDTLRSAAANGACPINYCRFLRASRKDLWECFVGDELTGADIPVSAKVVVNATGPWADGMSHSRVKLRLTKGVHMVVERSRLPVPETVVMTEGNRILFVIPWGERTIVGTTDTDYQGSREEVRVEEREVEYLLRIANSFFPGAKLSRRDILSAWAGLRPLLADKHGNPSDISRNHQITNPEPGWWDVAGGKLTTYRLMAEETVDQIVRHLERGEPQRKFSSCRTAEEPLLPTDQTNGVSGIVPPKVSAKTVEHFCTREWAVHLDDVIVRRTSWHYYLPDASEAAEEVADWMSGILGWSGEAKNAELDRYAESSAWKAQDRSDVGAAVSR